MIWKIAFRNLLRHKRRALTTGIIMMVGIAVFLVLDSLFLGVDKMTIDNMTSLSSPAVKLTSKSYENKADLFPLDYGIENYEDVLYKVKKMDTVLAATPRTSFRISASNYENELPLICIAIDPETDSSVFDFKDHLKGSWLLNEGEVLIGANLAKDLSVSIGDYLLVSGKTRYDSYNADEFLIAGILDTTDPMINRQSLVMSFLDAQNFADLDSLVTEIAIKTERPNALKKYISLTEQLAFEINETFPNLKAKSFFDDAKMVLMISKQKYYFSIFLVAIVLLIAMVGIVNSILMSVYERIREIGVLRAFGFKDKEIERLFIVEGLITGLIGSLLGMVLGSIGVYYLATYGYPIADMIGDIDLGEYPVWGTIYGTWNFLAMTIVSLVGILCGFLASWIPARKAGKLQVIETLRFV